MTTRAKVFLGLGLYLLTIVGFALIFGWSRDDNDAFQPKEEFRLDDWVDLGIFSINKAVLYLVIAAVLMCATMIFVANRMAARPNKVQTFIEVVYTAMRDNITRGNMPDKMAAKWFPFIAAIFLFIWFSNLIGYIPLPTNTHEKIDVLGLEIPSLALYAATANLSIPLVLALVVWLTYNVLGIKEKGPIGYLKSFIPAGVPGPLKPFILCLELASNFMRLISLSVRLFANILAGHLIILFMGGALVVILGIEALGVVTFPMAVALFLFEVGLVATLQAFIFATLTAIYIGGAVAESH
jgi:F-type H+-transporting ATPase subunit a